MAEIDEKTAESQENVAQDNTAAQQDSFDEKKVENTVFKAIKKFFGSVEKQPAQQEGAPQNQNNQQQSDKMQQTLEEIKKQNTAFVEKQELNGFVEDLRGQGVEIAAEDLKNCKNIKELKRALLARETKIDFSKHNDDFVEGVFAARLLDKQKQNEINKEQTKQLAQIISDNDKKIDPRYFSVEFGRIQKPSAEKQEELKKKYKGVL